jgi:predicted transcriptional regulator
MKVQIKQLEPNPYRDIEHYPINEEKVQRLADSINQTGFWDNVLARKADGKIQIAYGHHRLAALRKVMKPTDEVDIPVKPLDDATMIKVMANENMDEWKTSPGIIDETVKVAKRFLEEHPEEVRLVAHGRPDQPVGAPVVSKFLGWPEMRVRYALERLGLIEEGVVEPEAVRSLPTERAARDFVKAVKQFKPTPAQQKKAAANIAEMAKGDRGEAAVRGAITEQIYRKPKAEHKDFKLIELREEIKAAEKLARDLSSKLLTLIRFREEVKDQVYQTEIGALAVEFNVLIQALKSFIGGKNNVKQLKG